MRIILTLVAVLVLVGTAFAAPPNNGADPLYSSTGHVLSNPDGRSCDILYCPADVDDPAFRANLAAMTGGVVDYWDAVVETPTMDLLMEYDVAFTYPNYGYFDNVAMGDVLADYVDAGHNVILGVWSTYTIGNNLSGRIMTDGYSPVYSPGGNNHNTVDSYAGDGVTCLYDGVSAFEHNFRDYLVLQGAGVLDGTYLDGEIAAAYNGIGVIYVNGYPADANADWTMLVNNAACTCEGVIATEETTWSSVKSIYR